MTKTFFHKELSYQVLSCGYAVHSKLGPGLLESTYEICLEYELKRNGFVVEKQKSLPVIYDEVKLDAGYRIDLLVNHTIILELKSVESISDIHKAQLMTYLKLSALKVGYLINFNVSSLKDGILRIVV